MIRLKTLIALGLITPACCTARASAACGHRAIVYGHNYGHQAVAIANNFVVTQFAIPVGVPVAQTSYVQYGSATVGYGAPVQSSVVAAPVGDPVCQTCPNVAPNCHAGGCVKPAPQPDPAPPPSPPTPPAPAATLLQKNCASCHSGGAAKAGFRVDLPLTCEQKLSAIGALLNDDPAHRMPKGTSLDAGTLGKLIQELSK